VIVEGTPVDRGDPAALQAVRKRSIGFVFQQFNLIPCLTAAENVEYALNIKGIKGRAAREEAARVLGEVGLAAKLRSMPRDLSGGQKQRVAVARALAGRSPILLVDEPTANLDAQSAEQVLSLFRTLARSENRAILIVTHDPKVRAVVDRVLTISEGLLSTEPNAGQAQPLKGLWGSGPEDARGSFPRTPSTTAPRREPPRRFAPEPFSMT
jgi:putative ABC transport system ATP-binding protein